MRAVIVPPIALALSLLGMTFHIFKFSRWFLLAAGSIASRRITPLRFIASPYFRAVSYACAALFIGFWLYQPERGVTASPFYQFAEKSLASALPYFPTVALTGVIEAQRSAYSIKHGLGDFGAFPMITAYVKNGAGPSPLEQAEAQP